MILSPIIVVGDTKRIFVGTNSTGFKVTYESQYYTDRIWSRRKYVKLSIGADLLQQILCTIRIIRNIQDMIAEISSQL